MESRSILHIRIHSFFAAVEQKRRPELAGKPVIVGVPRGNTSGIVVSASREARGVEEGTSVRQAMRTCPDAVVLMAEQAVYKQVFNRLLDILARYSPLLEPDSPGGAYVDVTASRALFGDAALISADISARVSRDLGFPVSIGCAANRLISRVASGAGPMIQGFKLVPSGSEAKFLAPLPVRVLDAVSAKIEKRLGELGVKTVGQLAMIPERLLVRQFGVVGSAISKQSWGIDESQVRAAWPVEVVESERMFESPLEEPAEVEGYLRLMANDAVARLRKNSRLAGEITLVLCDDDRVQMPNPRFQIAESFRFKTPTDSPSSITQALVRMLEAKMRPGMEIYRVEVVLSDLTQGAASQLCLIGDGERRRRLDRAVELIRERFGDGSVVFAAAMGS